VQGDHFQWCCLLDKEQKQLQYQQQGRELLLHKLNGTILYYDTKNKQYTLDNGTAFLQAHQQ